MKCMITEEYFFVSVQIGPPFVVEIIICHVKDTLILI